MANATATVPRKADSLRDRAPLLLFLAGLPTALLMVLVGWRAQSLVSTTSDPYGYMAMGRSLVRGEGFAAYGSVLNRRGPLYPAFIALVFLITGDHPVVVQIL